MIFSLEAKQIIAAIVNDMKAGTVDADCPDFSALHNFVDANEYFLQFTDVFADGFDEDAFRKASFIADEVTWFLAHYGTTLAERVANKPII